jgi:nanoRNase/pAp phosphatase (c-di-AMP/oligoRNAs hydrolase)
MKRLSAAALLILAIAAPASAVSLRQVIRDCGPDGKIYCKGVSYGAPMQACLSRNKAKLTPVCRAVVERLDRGEKVRLFGG